MNITSLAISQILSLLKIIKKSVHKNKMINLLNPSKQITFLGLPNIKFPLCNLCIKIILNLSIINRAIDSTVEKLPNLQWV